MAHEIAHVAACHIAREQTRGTLAQLATIPLIMMGGGLGGLAVQEAAGLALPVTFLKFSRGFEAEADYLGVEYMYKAATIPRPLPHFLKRSRRRKRRSRERSPRRSSSSAHA